MFIKDFSKAGSIYDSTTAENMAQSIFINRSEGWAGGSINFDIFAIGVIFLAYYLDQARFSKIKSLTKIKQVATQYA